MPDPEVLAAIRQVIAASPFVARATKITARLRLRGICTSRKRVLRLMREHGLLAPTPQVRKRTKRLHTGRIATDAPDELWATDPTQAWTRQDGRRAVFAIVDHCTGEAWVDAAPRMDRFAAADLLREAITDRFGSVGAGAAAGLKLRHDGGSCFRSAHYQAEIDHLAIERSPAFHYEPEMCLIMVGPSGWAVRVPRARRPDSPSDLPPGVTAAWPHRGQAGHASGWPAVDLSAVGREAGPATVLIGDFAPAVAGCINTEMSRAGPGPLRLANDQEVTG